MRKQREADGRPCLTINRLPTFVRQVVNEARQNRPAIKVQGVDSQSDPATADIYAGLIRNIEYASDAEVAYDTAGECAIVSGRGYFRVDLEYAHEDTFDLDIKINAIANPFSVYGDPYSIKHDSSDWNIAFVTEQLSKDSFERKYKNAEPVDWAGDEAYRLMKEPWASGEMVQVAEYWRRDEVEKTILLMPNGSVLDKAVYDKNAELFQTLGMIPTRERKAKAHKVTQYILSGAEVLDEVEWAGKYIPIVPVYGEEINDQGKRMWRGLVYRAMDAQRMLNYWRTASTELVALAPRVPFVGKVGSFATDEDKWATINSQNHTHVEYDGDMPPTRQPLDSGSAIGAMQEALAAADDLKTITGIYDSALGQRSNETSGKAILARQRESDTGTFHFSDNLSRAIRHAGRICVDLIPHAYQAERAIRVLGEDKQQQVVQLAQRNDSGPLPDNTFDLSIGRYDVAVSVGPSFATRREEANVQLTEVIRAFPQSAPVLMDLMAKNWDWPGAEEAAKRLNALVPQQAMGEDPRLQQAQQAMAQLQQQAQQQIQQAQQQIQELTMQLKSLQSQNTVDAQKLELERQVEAVTARIKEQEVAIKQQEVQIKQFDSETKRLELLAAQEQARVAEMQAAMQAQQAPQPKHEMGMQHSMMGAQAKKPRMLRRGSATPQADGTVLINMAEEEIPLPPKTKRTNVQRLDDGRWLLESVEEGGPLETPVVKRGIAQKNGTGGWAVEHIEE